MDDILKLTIANSNTMIYIYLGIMSIDDSSIDILQQAFHKVMQTY